MARGTRRKGSRVVVKYMVGDDLWQQGYSESGFEDASLVVEIINAA